MATAWARGAKAVKMKNTDKIVKTAIINKIKRLPKSPLFRGKLSV
jgi:hypothetical protein